MMRSKMLTIVLIAILSVILGAAAFMIGMILGRGKEEQTVQADVGSTAVTTTIPETVSETTIITTELTTTVTTTTETDTTTTTTTTQPPKKIDVSYYQNYYPEIDQFVYNGIVATQGGDLNLRSLPAEDSEILAKIPNGSELAIYRTNETGWYWTSYNRIHGYIRSQYVTKSNNQQFEPVDHDERINPDYNYISKSKTFLFTGYVATNSDNLNLRGQPNTSSNTLAKIPKGTQLEIYSCDVSGWYWTSYNGQSGYVNAQYIKEVNETPAGHTPLPVSDQITTYSCNVTGIIMTYGATVPGYTTSYICEGGAMSMVRTSLGDGWHVQSSRYCFAYNTKWYELYDAWDGDYYGWVSSEYLAWD